MHYCKNDQKNGDLANIQCYNGLRTPKLYSPHS